MFIDHNMLKQGKILPGALPNKPPVAGAGAPNAGAGAGCPKAGAKCNKGKMSIREKSWTWIIQETEKMKILPGALPNKPPVAGAGAPNAGAGAG